MGGCRRWGDSAVYARQLSEWRCEWVSPGFRDEVQGSDASLVGRDVWVVGKAWGLGRQRTARRPVLLWGAQRRGLCRGAGASKGACEGAATAISEPRVGRRGVSPAAWGPWCCQRCCQARSCLAGAVAVEQG